MSTWTSFCVSRRRTEKQTAIPPQKKTNSKLPTPQKPLLPTHFFQEQPKTSTSDKIYNSLQADTTLWNDQQLKQLLGYTNEFQERHHRLQQYDHATIDLEQMFYTDAGASV